MTRKTKDTIGNVSRIYMSETNLQLQQKFASIISLRLDQVAGMIRDTPPDTLDFGEEMLKELKKSAEIRKFSYLGFYTEYKETDEKTAEQYVGELSAAMANGREYYTSIFLNGEEKQIYCSPIFSRSTWFLVSVMPNGDLDKTIRGFHKVRVGIMIGTIELKSEQGKGSQFHVILDLERAHADFAKIFTINLPFKRISAYYSID